MEDIAIYPFDLYSVPLIRHRKLITNQNIVEVVSPEGWGLEGKDISVFDGGSSIGVFINTNFEDAINKCDTVLFTRNEAELDFEKHIYPKIDKAINKGKNIINTLPLSREIIDDIINKCAYNNLKFRDFNIYNKQNDYSNILIENEYIFDIKKPVVFVLGLCDSIDKFEVQLTLREYFLKLGYKVSQIGSRDSCEFLGFYSFPKFMYSKNISESNKVVLFNHYVKKIEEDEDADIIIIGVPGGVMPFNKKVTNRFGILAYEVCQAVNPDITVVNTYYIDDYTYFEKISNSLKYKLGIEVSCFNISNKLVDLNEPWKDFKMHFITLDSDFVAGGIEKMAVGNCPLFNVSCKKDKNRISEFITNTLNSYASIEVT